MTVLDEAWLAAHPLPSPGEDTDKNRRGRVLAGGGSETVPGALLLVGEAALRAGAGKIQLAVPERTAIPLGVAMPEAAVFGLPVNAAGELGRPAGGKLAALVERCDALVLGPGTGNEADAVGFLEAVLAHGGDFALLLDAALLGAVPRVAERVRAHRGPVVLTPHPGEMASLMDCGEDEVAADGEALARRAAERFGATVVLKGSRTHIASPAGELLHYPGGGPGLATGGSGDVLAGAIGGLLARGADPLVAAAWGVWTHGEAGKLLAQRIGRLGFLGREIPLAIAGVLATGPGNRET